MGLQGRYWDKYVRKEELILTHLWNMIKGGGGEKKKKTKANVSVGLLAQDSDSIIFKSVEALSVPAQRVVGLENRWQRSEER